MDELIIVIPFYNNEKYTRQIINEIKTKTHSSYKLVLVNNGSTDSTSQLLSEYKYDPSIHIINNSKNVGVTKAWNQGVEVIKEASYYAILNNDILLTDNCIDRLVGMMDKEPKIGIISPFPIDECYVSGADFSTKAEDIKKKFTAGSTMDGMHGCCFILRGEVLRKVGLFDEKMEQVFSDFDMCKRVEDAGYETRIVFDPLIFHYGCKTQETIDKRLRDGYYRKDQMEYFKKHGCPTYPFTINSGKIRRTQ